MKNKVIALLTIGFAVFFLIFVVRITDDMSKAHDNILNSPNVINATDLISTHVLVTSENLPTDGTWTKPSFDERNWLPIKIPYYRIVQNEEFKEGSFAYYRIKIPRSAFKKFEFLKNESSIVLQGIYFSQVDITINGRFIRTKKPKTALEAKTIVPVSEGMDNIIGIKGSIKAGDTGIDSRNPILLGREVELDEIHRASYKAQTVFQLVFILCKGSILFIFALIYLLLNVDRSFEKFFIFGLCAVVEELIAGDYLYGPLTFNQMVYLYDLANFGAAVSVFLFFAELSGIKLNKLYFKIFGSLLFVISILLTADALYWNYILDISKFMKFWNLVTLSIMLFYIPKAFKTSLDLFFGLALVISLYLWGALFAENIGLNFKAYGNLLLFFMVAYKTFVIFRREQEQLQFNERKLLEQEKDVAIGKTAALLAHDVRKPLEQIKLVFEKISTGDADKNFLDIAKRDIDFSIDSVSHQIDDIMNFSKTSLISTKPVSFYKVLRHSIKQVMSIHQEMDIELEYDFGCDKIIMAEESRLSSVLINLLSNAVEAIRDIGGKYQGKIRFHTSESHGRFAFALYNDGPEIPKDIMSEIFKPLFTYAKAGGTGLGLASVVKAMNEQQGSVAVRNINHGVEFNLNFIMTTDPDLIELEKFLKSSKAYNYTQIVDSTIAFESSSLRVLVLENNSELIAKIESGLAKLPYKTTIVTVSSAALADESISKMRFDLYLLNLALQGEELRQKSLAFLKSEVILYSNSNLPNFDNTIISEIYQKRPKILFVDDTKLFRVAWQIYHGDHNIQCFSSPEQILQFLGEIQYFFKYVVIDYHFSNSTLNGEELGRRIEMLFPQSRILIASSADQQVAFRCISKREFEIRKYYID